MIVTLPERVFFSPETSQLDLLALVQLCWEERHHLLVEPAYPDLDIERWLLPPGATSAPAPEAPPALAGWLGWLQALPADLGRRVHQVLGQGPERAASDATRCRLRIDMVNGPDWHQKEPVVDLGTALRLLRTPLRLLVENRHNDGLFVRLMVTPGHTARFEQALGQGWIEFEHGGGSDLKRRVEEAARDPLLAARLWVMFDHDGNDPAQPSDSSKKVALRCGDINRPWALGWFRLQRREIENYLSQPALERWARDADARFERRRPRVRRDGRGDGQEAQPRRSLHQQRCEAFHRLDLAQRFFFDLKCGLGKHRDSETKALPDLFLPLDQPGRERDRHLLLRGFGEKLWSEVYEMTRRQQGRTLREELVLCQVPESERAALIDSIFERL